MPEKPFYRLKDTDKFTLIVKSKNRPGVPVFREDLPAVLFNRAPRVICGSTWFSNYSKENHSTVCECCLGTGSLERHEVYGLYKWNGEYCIKLEYVLKLCSSCHKKIHGGFSEKLSMRYGYIPMPIPKSDCMNTKKYPWNKAKFILIGQDIYLL